MTVLYVAGQQPGAGATAVASALAVAWQQTGRRVALLKPLSLGGDGERDIALFQYLLGTSDAQKQAVVGSSSLDDGVLDVAVRQVEATAKVADVVIVEGLPLTDGANTPVAASPVLAQRINAKVVGVVPYSKDPEPEMGSAWRNAFGGHLAGVIVNRRTKYSTTDATNRLVPELTAGGIPVFGVVPEERAMLASTVYQVADHLGARFYVEPTGADPLIEHFLIGGLILEWGVKYFDRFASQGVIVRAGRPEIAMSALQCPLSCLILTGGGEPAQYVYQRAAEEAVALMVVDTNTVATAEALETVSQRASVHHPAKVERFATVLQEQLDWDALQSACGLN